MGSSRLGAMRLRRRGKWAAGGSPRPQADGPVMKPSQFRGLLGRPWPRCALA